jgi:hypothetical protein
VADYSLLTAADVQALIGYLNYKCLTQNSGGQEQGSCMERQVETFLAAMISPGKPREKK